MTRQTVTDILNLLADIHSKMPDLAFGEILQVCVDRKKKCQNHNLCNMADKEFLTALQTYHHHEVTMRERGKIITARNEKRQNRLVENLRRHKDEEALGKIRSLKASQDHKVKIMEGTDGPIIP